PAAALGRPAAARRRGARTDPHAVLDPRRRADRESPLESGEGDHGAVHAAEPRRDDDRAGDPLGRERAVRESHRAAAGWVGGEMIDTLFQDLRYALRTLAKSQGFSFIVVLTLALGIGANTAIFSVVNGVLLRSLPYPKPDALMQVETVFQNGAGSNVSYPNFEDLRDQNRSFANLAVYANWTAPAAAAGEGFRVALAKVSASFFPVLGVPPVVGRVFSADEERAGQRVAVVSYGYWQSRLGGSASFAGQTVHAGDEAYAVIGVMPRGYDFPLGTELWLPREPRTEYRTAENWHVVGRL